VITLLEEMTAVALATVDAARVLTTEALHEASDRHIRNLEGEMDCVDFPAERVHARAAAREHRRQESFENRIIGGVGKNRSMGVATLDDVVNTFGYMKS
jgi:hypothetical protein